MRRVILGQGVKKIIDFSSTSIWLQNNQLWLLPFLIWELVWKGLALWKSARNSQSYWFVAILIFNTLGVLPIVYIAFFQKKVR